MNIFSLIHRKEKEEEEKEKRKRGEGKKREQAEEETVTAVYCSKLQTEYAFSVPIYLWCQHYMYVCVGGSFPVIATWHQSPTTIYKIRVSHLVHDQD